MTAAAAAEALKAAMRRLPTGVVVLSTRYRPDPDGPLVDHAMTASSLTSVSVDPLLVLFSVGRSSRFHPAVLAGGVVGMSVLAGDQVDAARWFATSGRPVEGQLASFAHHRGPVTGTALLTGSVATLEGRVHAVHPAGQADIVVVEVLGVDVPEPDRASMVHRDRRYSALL